MTARSDERDPLPERDWRPTLANWSETCDWGHCNGQSYAVRWADDLGLWLSVCRKHRARDVVPFEELDDEGPTRGLWDKRNTPSGHFDAIKRSGDVFKGVKREN